MDFDQRLRQQHMDRLVRERQARDLLMSTQSRPSEAEERARNLRHREETAKREFFRLSTDYRLIDKSMTSWRMNDIYKMSEEIGVEAVERVNAALREAILSRIPLQDDIEDVFGPGVW